MKLYLISYTPGYSGDFIASLVHKDKKFYQIDDVERTHDNRHLFPNFTNTFHSKMTNNIDNFMLLDDYKFLKEKYNKNLCINTHMFDDIKGPYDKKVKIYASSITTTRISYAMWWHKSHIINEQPDRERIHEIKTNKNIPDILIYNYSKWKYLSWKKLGNVQITLEDYVKEMYKFSSGAGGTKSFHENFVNLDLDKCLYVDEPDTTLLDSTFDVKIDKNRLKKYRDKNYQALEQMKVDVNSNKFFQQLTEYVQRTIDQNGIDLSSKMLNI